MRIRTPMCQKVDDSLRRTTSFNLKWKQPLTQSKKQRHASWRSSQKRNDKETNDKEVNNKGTNDKETKKQETNDKWQRKMKQMIKK